MRDFINQQKNKILQGVALSKDSATKLLDVQGKDLYILFSAANEIRTHFRGNKAHLCAITNAKSGKCSEDCAFCAQSSHYSTSQPSYPLIDPQEMLVRAEKAVEAKTHRFCLVVSGCSLNEQELAFLCEGIRLIKNKFPNLLLDASLGQLTEAQAQRLKDAGLSRYNHNIETVEDFFSKIVTTHTFKDRVKTLRVLKKVGLEICCGGIFGLGESPKQRIEFAYALKDLDIDCIPLNFLNPIAGTPLENSAPIAPLELVKIVAIFRLVHPKKEIKICGGRESCLKELQSLIFQAGSDSIIIGDYLTTKGNKAEEDLKMVKASGLEV
ncbi:biotin synthase BioB [Candidatus Omnitrophota bacterium]